MPKNTIWLALILLVFSMACGGGNEWNGKISGETELQDGSGSTIEKGKGTASLEQGLDHHLKMGKDTPLADCDITFFPGSLSSGSSDKMEFKIKNADGIKCKGSLGKGAAATDIYIQSGSAVTATSDGVFTVLIYYGSDASGEKRTFILTGKKGWF